MNDFSQLCQNYIVATNEEVFIYSKKYVEDVLAYSRGQKKHKIYRKISVEVCLLTGTHWNEKSNFKFDDLIPSSCDETININFYNYIFTLFFYFIFQ